MKIKKPGYLKIRIQLVLALAAIFLAGESFNKGIEAFDYSGERIVYTILPAGKAEYADLGLVQLQGRPVKLIVFKSRVLGFDDTEKIYSDPKTMLPIRVERDIKMWLSKENIVEEYDQKKGTVTISKFKGNKKIHQQILREDNSVHNAILLPFYVRFLPEMKIGWNFDARLPNKFKITLASIDEIKVPGGKFKAYHFTSIPDKFEIWISKDRQRIPIKIKGKGGLGYTLAMKEYSPNDNK